jgi:hypothetical protein
LHLSLPAHQDHRRVPGPLREIVRRRVIDQPREIDHRKVTDPRVTGHPRVTGRQGHKSQNKTTNQITESIIKGTHQVPFINRGNSMRADGHPIMVHT